MSDVNLVDAVSKALDRLLHLPVLGPTTSQLWDALDLTAVADLVLGSLAEKAQLTSEDQQLHSFSLMLPGPGQLMVIVTCMTWPEPLSESRDQAREQFFKGVSMFAHREELAGFLQLDLFFGGAESPEMRIAWLPFPQTSSHLVDPLRRSVLPWGTEPRTPLEKEPPPPTSPDIVALAEIAWELTKMMRERLRYWPDENGPALPNFQKITEQWGAVTERFNDAAEKLTLGHVMPISRFDDTWLPHNIANALRFESLPASLSADLLRLWGPDAKELFVRSWNLLKASPGESITQLLAPLRESSLSLQRVEASSVAPKSVDVFISYAWSDKTRGARDIFALITGSGLSAWIDEEQRLDDTRLNDEVLAVMLLSERVVICISLEMLTRGGYAMHEVLLAISSMPDRCLIAQLDRIPLPAIFGGIRAVNWYEPNGPDELCAALQKPITRAAGEPETRTLKLEGPVIEQLLALLRRPERCFRYRDAPNRTEEVNWRSRLFALLSTLVHLRNKGDFDTILATIDKAPGIFQSSALNGASVVADPTIFGALVRLRSVLFQAHVHAGVHSEWQFHNRRAYDLLEEFLAIEPALLRPASHVGWLTEDCRLAHQDCLDALVFAKEWFRSWSPEALAHTCGAPADSTATVENRVNLKLALLGERMLALRAWEELKVDPELVPSWANTWSSLRKEITGKLRVGAHPSTKAYFDELRLALSGPSVDKIATSMTDGVIESRLGEDCREEFFLDLQAFRARCIVRSYKSLANKRASLASVRGTVFKDLKGAGSEEADLNILFSIFTQQGTVPDDWKYGLFINCAPGTHARTEKRLPSILLGSFFTAEMLSDEERAMSDSSAHEIHEEL